MIVKKKGESKVFGCVWERNWREERDNLPRKTTKILFFFCCKMRGLEAFMAEK